MFDLRGGRDAARRCRLPGTHAARRWNFKPASSTRGSIEALAFRRRAKKQGAGVKARIRRTGYGTSFRRSCITRASTILSIQQWEPCAACTVRFSMTDGASPADTRRQSWGSILTKSCALLPSRTAKQCWATLKKDRSEKGPSSLDFRQEHGILVGRNNALHLGWNAFMSAASPIGKREDGSPSTPVLIVGAGPIGLALALDLARRGIASTVVEQTDGAVDTRSSD